MTADAAPTVDRYQERIDRGECAWCEDQATLTVCFEDCDHATPVCAAHFDEYFEGVGWEWARLGYNWEPACPDCAG